MFSNAPSMMLFVLALPFLAAFAAPTLTKHFKHNASWVLALAPAFMFLHFIGFISPIADGVASGENAEGYITGGYSWIPALGISFSWLLDGLSLTFALLITGIGTLIVIYAGGYLKGHPQQGRFLAFILLFMGAMIGVVTADSFFMFFIYWELTSITSFLLIGFNNERSASRRAALQALVVTGGGGLFLLAGLILMSFVSGGHSHFSAIFAFAPDLFVQSPFYLAILFLILMGAFTKSAQFPFHFWLPNAMEAPTPVSAYLHSATMVKAGVYLLMRLSPVLAGGDAWQWILPIFGGTTLIVGTTLAIKQIDLKLMLAYTTVSSLGLLVMLLGFDSEYAVVAAILYLIAHSLFKGALFMVAGIIDHEAGTRDVTKLGGLRSLMPITFAAALVSAISMAGLPPLFGFLAKEKIYEALWATDPWSLTFVVVALIGNALMFVIGFAVALKPFLGEKTDTPKPAHEGPIALWLGPVVLGAIAVLIAVFALNVTHYYVTTPFASALLSPMNIEFFAEFRPKPVEVWFIPHSLAPPLLSLLTVISGVLAYRKLDALRDMTARFYNWIFGGWGVDKGFDNFISGIVKFAFAITNKVQSGRLQIYMSITFIVIAATLWAPMIIFDELPKWPDFSGEIQFYEAAIMLIGFIGLVAVVFAKDRLTAIVSLGIQGFAVALIFMLFGAPDLSFTQFMVETLSVVILALVMTRLRLYPTDHRSLPSALRDFTIALACGTGLSLYLIRVTQGTFDPFISNFFETYSKVIAHGANIVNVILVDYRGTDTWGEIAVVMVTGLAILALVRVRTNSGKNVADNDPDLLPNDEVKS